MTRRPIRPFTVTQTIAGTIVTITYDRTIDRFWLDVAGVRMAATHYSRAAAEAHARQQLATMPQVAADLTRSICIR